MPSTNISVWIQNTQLKTAAEGVVSGGQLPLLAALEEHLLPDAQPEERLGARGLGHRGVGDLRGAGVPAVWTPALAMLAFAAVTAAVAFSPTNLSFVLPHTFSATFLKMMPSASTVPRSLMKQAARMILPISVLLRPVSTMTA